MTSLPKSNSFYSILPNALSVIRGIIGFTLPILCFSPNFAVRMTAPALFFFGAMTDYWDGSIARKFNVISKVGKILDPSMDKILVLVPMIVFAQKGIYSIWWVVPIFIREFVITFCRIAWLMEGQAVGAERLGKLKFGVQVSTLACAFAVETLRDLEKYSASNFFYWILYPLLIASVALTVISGISVLRNNRKNCEHQSFAKFTSAVGVGLLPIIPGTWGSAFGVVLVLLTYWNPVLYVTTFLAVLALGYWAVSKLDLSHDKDPQFVVVDEVCGIFITFFAIKLNFLVLIIGFVLFRIMDIIKPPPARQFEKLPGYWGILCDDLAAGVYAWLLLLVVQKIFSL